MAKDSKDLADIGIFSDHAAAIGIFEDVLPDGYTAYYDKVINPPGSTYSVAININNTNLSPGDTIDTATESVFEGITAVMVAAGAEVKGFVSSGYNIVPISPIVAGDKHEADLLLDAMKFYVAEECPGKFEEMNRVVVSAKAKGLRSSVQAER